MQVTTGAAERERHSAMRTNNIMCNDCIWRRTFTHVGHDSTVSKGVTKTLEAGSQCHFVCTWRGWTTLAGSAGRCAIAHLRSTTRANGDSPQCSASRISYLHRTLFHAKLFAPRCLLCFSALTCYQVVSACRCAASPTKISCNPPVREAADQIKRKLPEQAHAACAILYLVSKAAPAHGKHQR